MATIMRSHAARICRAGLNLVSRTCQPVPLTGQSGVDNPTILTRLFGNNRKLANCSFSTTSQCTGSVSTTKTILKTVYTQATISNRRSFLNGVCPNRCLLQASCPTMLSSRSKIYYSKKKGKPKTVHAVVKRFFRLDWGIWIRTRAGRHKKLWKKSLGRQYRLRQHVFCNKTQSKLLDKMTTEYWRKPKYFVDDPYEPYQKRTNFPQYFPERKRPFYP